MPSNNKQAELRRLMKLQLEKQQQQELEKKNAPPKSILKQPSNTPAATNKPSAVSSLLEAYSDDDESDQESFMTKVSWPQNDEQLKKTRIIEPSSVEQPERKRARFAAVDTQEEQVKVPAPQTATTETINTEMVQPKVAALQQQKQVASVDTEMEFQALLEEADKPTKEEQDSTAEDESKPEKDEPDSFIDTTEIEQVSYEARIAKLRLKAAARRKRKAPDIATNVDTFTPELAEQDNDESENTKTSSDNLSPLEILRQKRKERAQQLQDE